MTVSILVFFLELEIHKISESFHTDCQQQQSKKVFQRDLEDETRDQQAA